jgi:hypothetical protein
LFAYYGSKEKKEGNKEEGDKEKAPIIFFPFVSH